MGTSGQSGYGFCNFGLKLGQDLRGSGHTSPPKDISSSSQDPCIPHQNTTTIDIVFLISTNLAAIEYFKQTAFV